MFGRFLKDVGLSMEGSLQKNQARVDRKGMHLSLVGIIILVSVLAGSLGILALRLGSILAYDSPLSYGSLSFRNGALAFVDVSLASAAAVAIMMVLEWRRSRLVDMRRFVVFLFLVSMASAAYFARFYGTDTMAVRPVWVMVHGAVFLAPAVVAVWLRRAADSLPRMLSLSEVIKAVRNPIACLLFVLALFFIIPSGLRLWSYLDTPDAGMIFLRGILLVSAGVALFVGVLSLLRSPVRSLRHRLELVVGSSSLFWGASIGADAVFRCGMYSGTGFPPEALILPVEVGPMAVRAASLGMIFLITVWWETRGSRWNPEGVASIVG